MKNILFCNLSIVPNKINLPYNWACLKTHCETSEQLRHNYKWLNPIFMGNGIQQVFILMTMHKIDVLCLSNYTWNQDRNYQVAEIVKSINPNCIIIAGGPEPDYNDKNYFKKYPLIDIVVKGEGEVTFHKLLSGLLYNISLELIPGLILPKGYDRIPYDTGDPIKIKDLSLSPYLEQKEYFEKLLDDSKIDKNDLFGDINILWETSRGCPYKCAYCKWDFTDSKINIRKIPMERLKKEIDWFNTIDKNFFLHILDSNYGLFERDYEITKYLCDHLTTDKLSFLHAAFDKKEVYNNKIIKLLYDNKLIRTKNIGIQHTDKEVLKNMKRYPVDINKVISKDMPNMGHVILGGPGDTLEKWSKCLTDLIEVGLDEFIIYRYHVFANSHASTKEFLEKNEIKTIKRFFQNYTREKSIYMDHKPNTDIIVKTSSYNELEYVLMSIYGAMINVFHTGGITRYLAKYLIDEGITTYHKFYNRLFNYLQTCDGYINTTFKICKEQIRKFVTDDYSLEELEILLVPNSKYLYKVEEFMLFNYLYKIDHTFEFLMSFLNDSYGLTPEILDLLDYQKQLLITIDYNNKIGKKFSNNYDWKKYFECGKLDKIDCEYEIKDKRCGYGVLMDWYDYKGEERIQHYINAVIGTFYKRYNRSIFQQINRTK